MKITRDVYVTSEAELGQLLDPATRDFVRFSMSTTDMTGYWTKLATVTFEVPEPVLHELLPKVVARFDTKLADLDQKYADARAELLRQKQTFLALTYSVQEPDPAPESELRPVQCDVTSAKDRLARLGFKCVKTGCGFRWRDGHTRLGIWGDLYRAKARRDGSWRYVMLNNHLPEVIEEPLNPDGYPCIISDHRPETCDEGAFIAIPEDSRFTEFLQKHLIEWEGGF